MAAGPISYSELFNELGPGKQELADFTKEVQALNRNYKAFAKNIEADGAKVATGLALIAQNTQALRTQVTGINLASEQERASLAALGAEIAKLAQQQQLLKAAKAGQAGIDKAAGEAVKGYTAELKKQRDALREAYAAGNTEVAKQAAQAILALKRETEDLNRALRGANSSFTAAQGSYRALENEARQLDSQLKALAGGMQADSAEAQQMKARLAEVNQAIITFGKDTNQGYKNVGRYAEGIIEAVGALEKQRRALLADAAALRTQSQATGLSTEQQNKLQAEIKQTEAELGKVNGQLRNYGVGVKQGGGFTAGLANNVGGLGQAFAGAYFGVQGLATVLKGVFSDLVNYSDALADVRKTTGLSADEAARLAENLKQIDTRSSLAELLDIAKVAGQLGIAKDEVLGFTKAIDIANQALSDDFQGNAEEIATQLGKIGVVFRKQFEGKNTEQKLLDIGSALNELGAVGAATAPQLADVALRVGATAANAGVGLPQVLAYAAVLQELGFSAEVSGTALNRIINTLTGRTAEAFRIAKLADTNLTLKEFKRLLNTDMDAALQLFLRGLNSGNTTTTSFSAKLATLKLNSGEAKSALTALAKNTELVAERQKTANEQLKIGTSLAAEAAVKNDTLAGSWAKLKNGLSNLFTEGFFAGQLKDVIDEQRARLQAVGDAFRYIKTQALAASEAVAKSSFGKKLGLDSVLPTKAPVDFASSTLSATKSLAKQAEEAQKLLDRYQQLTAAATRTSAQQVELNNITLRLQKMLGSEVVQVDKGTQALSLNTSAVGRAIAAKQRQAQINKDLLADQLAYFDSTILPSVEGQVAELQQAVGKAQLGVTKAGIGESRVKDIREALAYREEVRKTLGPTAQTREVDNLPKTQVRTVEALTTAEKALAESEAELKRQQQERARIAAALAALTKKTTDATKANTQATTDDFEADKKKKAAVADVAKEEYLRRKQQLEAQIADLDRQYDNPANSEEIRTRAAQKGTAARIELAKLEQNELLREARQANAEKINGEQALGVVRVRLSEDFKNKSIEIERTGDKRLLALRNALLDQLADVDRLVIEGELAALDRIVANENLTYQERQQAALQAADRRIEIVDLQADKEVRAAQGSAGKIKEIRQKQANDTAAIQAAARPFNADLANDDLAKQYRAQQLALENSRAAGEYTEKQYYRTLELLEDANLQQKLDNLKKDATKQQEAADLELEIARRKNDRELAEFREKEETKRRIIQQGFAITQSYADAFFQYSSDLRSAEMDNIQAERDRNLANAGENAVLRAQIEDNFHRRSLALKREQAQFDKAAAIFSIAINTAQAVIAAVAEFPGPVGIAFGAAVGVLGAAQIAAVMSKPLPAYFKGREGGPAELAIVGERGPELVGHESRGFRLVAQETVTRLEAGDRVITAPRTEQILQQNELIGGRLVQRRYEADMEQQAQSLRASAPGRQASREAAAARAAYHSSRLDLERLGDRIVQAVESQEQLRVSEGELQRFVKKGDTWLQKVNKRYRRQ